MKTLLLLDVDGVLLNWDAQERRSPPTLEETGYDDWVPSGKKWFTYYSPQQLADIAAAPFDVYWHTTWGLDHNHPKMLRYFAEVTGFAPTERRLLDKLPIDWEFGQAWEQSRLVIIDEWWKSHVIREVATLEPEFFQGYDRVLWVDDELRNEHDNASKMLTDTGADKGPEWVLIECTQGAWDRTSIWHHRAFHHGMEGAERYADVLTALAEYDAT